MEGEGRQAKAHRKRASGRKAEKKKAKTPIEEMPAKQRNPKAFSYHSVNKVSRMVRRTMDIKEKRHHIPEVDRTPIEPPPVVVAVVGPPKVGKSTVIQCLIKNFTRQKLSAINGPVTIVSGKKRRLTLLECNNDINCMIDVAKVADLVLLLVDASFGFEMEIFEFLNICQVHGFPKIMGVLTHLDHFRHNKTLKTTKKRLKHRFWTEVYQGAKLFYLSGMVNGEYQKTEIHNLGRFISVMKFRPLQWRTTHPYVIADRMEDVTDPETVRLNPKADRSVCLYGYVRGTHFKNNANIHIPGCGDFTVREMSFLPDPCSLPNKEKRRALNEKERLIYAPMSGVGGIVYDKDAVYIDLGGSHSHNVQEEEDTRPTNELVTGLIDAQHTLDIKMAASQVSLFKGAAPISNSKSDDDVPMRLPQEKLIEDKDGRTRRKAIFGDEDMEDSEDEDEDEEMESDLEVDEEEDTEEEDSSVEILEGDGEEVPKSAKRTKVDKKEFAYEDKDQTLEDETFNIFSSDHSSKTKDSSSKFGMSKNGKKNEQISEDEQDTDSDDDEEKGDGVSDDDRQEEEGDDEEKEEDHLNVVQTKKGKDISLQMKKTFTKQSPVDDQNESNSPGWVEVVSRKTKRKNRITNLVDSQWRKSNLLDLKDNENKSSDIYSLTKDAKDTINISKLKQTVMESLGKKERKQRNTLESISGKLSEKSESGLAHSKDQDRSESPSDTDDVVQDEEEDMSIVDSEEDASGDDDQTEMSSTEDDDDDVSNNDLVIKDEGSDSSEASSGEEESGQLKWKDNLKEKAALAFQKRKLETPNLRKLVYGNVIEVDENEDEEEVGGLFKVAGRDISRKKQDKSLANGLDCSHFPPSSLQDWDLEEVMESIRDCFVTGNWEEADAEALLKEDDEMFGDFEDLETGEVFKSKEADESSDKSDKEVEPEVEQKGTWLEELEKKRAAKRVEKKERMKKMFDNEYDEKDGGGTYYDDLKSEVEQQAQLNRAEFEHMDEETRTQYEGFRPGMYARVQIDHMPCEFVTNFDPTYPVIMGALLSAEQNIGYVQLRLKKHRWHKRILKTRDPLILSMGWRRFQTVVMYSIQDHNMRHRLLKYTPEHLHCHASFWGPITPQTTGVLAVQTVAGNTPEFRIAATGVVIELDKSFTVVKKLKLTGTPFKIYKKTAFIQGMFTSALEVAKFEGSQIRTVSGIRGQVKKSVTSPEGAFRATFEDKILLSDIAFIRTWFTVAIPKFYNPVTTLLLPAEKKTEWQGMKTAGQLRRERGVPRHVNKDHLYKPIERTERVFAPLTIPKDLQKALPFKDKPKLAREIHDPIQSQRPAVVMEAKEKKVAHLMKMLKTLHEHKMRQRRQTMRSRAAQHQKQMARIEDKRTAKQRETKKEIYRVLGKAAKRKEKHQRD